MFFALLASHGIGANLLKVGTKRRRTRQEILDEKEEARLKEESIEEKLAALEGLALRCARSEAKAKENESANDILKSFLDKGMAVIGDDGVWIVNPNLQAPMQFNPDDLSQGTQEQQQPPAFMDE